jgi:hypothetical protein
VRVPLRSSALQRSATIGRTPYREPSPLFHAVLRVVLTFVIGTTLAGAQIQNGGPPRKARDLGSLAIELPVLSERLETLFDVETPTRWPVGFRLLRGMGESALPTVLQSWTHESRRGRRMLLGAGAVFAAGDRGLGAVASRLRQLSRDGQIDERVCALFSIAVSQRQVVSLVEGGDVEFLVDVASRRGAAIERVVACLALSRTREAMATRVPLQRGLAAIRRLATSSTDPGLATAALLASAAVVDEAIPAVPIRWVRARGRPEHADLVLAGAHLADVVRVRALRAANARGLAPSRLVGSITPELFDSAWDDRELAGAVDGTEPLAALCAAVALALRLDEQDDSARSWLEARGSTSVPPAALRVGLCATAAGRAEAMRAGWLRAVPDGRGLVDPLRRARLALAWTLASSPEEACRRYVDQVRDSEIADACGAGLAWKLLELEPDVASAAVGSAGVARVLDADVAAWSLWMRAAMGADLRRGEPPRTGDDLFDAASAALLDGRLTRAGARRALEDAVWRTGVHPSRIAHECRLDWIAQAMLVGSNSGAASLGVESERRDAAYLPDGVDETADRFFSVLAEIWKFAYRSGESTPRELRQTVGPR